MPIGSVANGLNSLGVFCAGSRIVADHQRINGTSFVFSATVPAVLAVSISEGINILWSTPSILSTLQEDVRAIRTVLDRIDTLSILSHAASLIIHIHLRTAKPSLSVAAPEDPEPPLPRLRAVHRRSTLRARSASCRTSWTMCSRRACGSQGLGAGVGRSSLNHGREFASLRCRARSASARLGSSRLPSQRCPRSENE